MSFLFPAVPQKTQGEVSAGCGRFEYREVSWMEQWPPRKVPAVFDLLLANPGSDTANSSTACRVCIAAYALSMSPTSCACLSAVAMNKSVSACQPPDVEAEGEGKMEDLGEQY